MGGYDGRHSGCTDSGTGCFGGVPSARPRVHKIWASRGFLKLVCLLLTQLCTDVLLLCMQVQCRCAPRSCEGYTVVHMCTGFSYAECCLSIKIRS